MCLIKHIVFILDELIFKMRKYNEIVKIRPYFFLFMFITYSSCTHKKQTPEIADMTGIVEFAIDCSIRALEVEDEGTCWFAGDKSKFGYTKDFGKSWKTLTVEYDTFDLQFRSIAVTKNAAFILSVGTPALLFKIDKQTLDYKLVYKEVGDKVFYNSMQFWDDKNGIAIGDPVENCMSILLTHDGGSTWNKLACENLPMVHEGEAAFAASDTNISLVSDKAYVVTGGKVANVLVGSEYGKGWNKFKTPIQQGGQMTGIFSTDYLNEKTGIIAGGDWEVKNKVERAMAITRDGGRSWELVDGNPGFVSCVQFVPKTKAVLACSTTGIYYSEYLAESWKKLSNEGYYGFRFSESGERLYFSGKNKLMSVDINTLLKK